MILSELNAFAYTIRNFYQIRLQYKLNLYLRIAILNLLHKLYNMIQIIFQNDLIFNIYHLLKHKYGCHPKALQTRIVQPFYDHK